MLPKKWKVTCKLLYEVNTWVRPYSTTEFIEHVEKIMFVWALHTSTLIVITYDILFNINVNISQVVLLKPSFLSISFINRHFYSHILANHECIIKAYCMCEMFVNKQLVIFTISLHRDFLVALKNLVSILLGVTLWHDHSSSLVIIKALCYMGFTPRFTPTRDMLQTKLKYTIEYCGRAIIGHGAY